MTEIIFERNPENAKTMAAYMKNLFPFAGVPAPARKASSKQLLKESKQWPVADILTAVDQYYHKSEREYHYLAIDLATANVQRLSFEEMQWFKPYVTENVWWDSVDAWRKFFGLWGASHFEELPALFDLFYGDENFWNRRVAINLQLMYKEKTDTELLKKAIIYDRTTEEFFIQKAIGWSLRQYSKVEPKWVAEFMEQVTLSPLATREGSKYLPKE